MATSNFMSAPSSSSATTAFKIDRLPAIVFHEILSYFKYEELANCRLVNQFFKRSVEKRLNDAFSRLGREITDLSLLLKRRLPRKESERKDHPLNRYSEIASSMETRYTLLSMTYKKYIDTGLTCFAPGKVLDLSFNVVNMLKGYVRRDVYVQLNAISVMRDIRDYSTMATEHFDLHIAPILSRRCQELVTSRRSLESHRTYGTTAPALRPSSSFYAYSFGVLPTYDYDLADIPSPNQATSSRVSEQLDAQGKQIEDIRKLVSVQNNAILHISEVLKEVTKYLPPVQSSNFSALVQTMNSNSANLQEMVNPSTSSALKRKAPSDWLSDRNAKKSPMPSTSSAPHLPKSQAPEPSIPTDRTSAPRYSLRIRPKLTANTTKITSTNQKQRSNQTDDNTKRSRKK